MAEIVEAFIVASEDQVKRTADRLEQKRLRELAENERRKIESQRKKEQAMVSELVALAEEHSRARQVRAFLKDLSEYYPDNVEISESIQKARELIDKVAPIAYTERFTEIFEKKSDYYY